MKRLITLILVVCSLAAFSQSPVKYYTKTEADARYPQISQGFQLEDSVYFKDQIDALFLEKTIGMYNLLISLGSDVKGVPVGANFANTSNVALADNIQYFCMCYVPRDTTVTGIRFVQAVQGSYTPDNTNGVALYSFSGTTYTKVVESTNDTADPNLFEATANTVVTKAFSTPTHIAKGFYAVSFLYNTSLQVTASTLSSVSITTSDDIQFEYNGTTAVKNIYLQWPSIEAVNTTKYVGVQTLQPYTSMVYLKDPNPAAPPTPPTGSKVGLKSGKAAFIGNKIAIKQ